MRANLVFRWLVPHSPDSSVHGVRADRALLVAIERGDGEWHGLVEKAAEGSAERSAERSNRPPVSRSLLQKRFEAGAVRVDGRTLAASTKLRPGSRVEIEFPPPIALALVPEDRALEILFEDADLVVVNKPPGLTVHPSPTQMEGTLVHALLHHVRDLSGIGGVLRPGIVHRIDKDTSGALVVTKTDRAHTKLVEVFAAHAIERRYWALVYGSPPWSATRIESTIGRSPRDRKKMAMDVPEGRRAVTHLKVIERYGASDAKPFATLVEATLETGRTHQVRVHLTGAGHSLLGDPVYGMPTERHPKWLALPAEIREAVEALPGQALHARVLGFAHPVTGAPLRFEATPPPAFDLLSRALGRYR